jgi:hypothetical protein
MQSCSQHPVKKRGLYTLRKAAEFSVPYLISMQWGTDHDFCMSPGDSSEQDAEGQDTRLNVGNQHEMQVTPADGGGHCTSHMGRVLAIWFSLCEPVHRLLFGRGVAMYITMQPADHIRCKKREGGCALWCVVCSLFCLASFKRCVHGILVSHPVFSKCCTADSFSPLCHSMCALHR